MAAIGHLDKPGIPTIISSAPGHLAHPRHPGHQRKDYRESLTRLPPPETRALRPRRRHCLRDHSPTGPRPALPTALALHTIHTDRTCPAATAAHRVRPSQPGLGVKHVQAGRRRDESPRRHGPWPKAGPPYSSGGPRRPKCCKALARENTLRHFQRSSRDPDFRAPRSICQHAVVNPFRPQHNLTSRPIR